MGEMIKKSVFTSLAMIALVGTAWGGWFSFEPNILLMDGAYVARELEDLQKEIHYREKGDTAHAEELIRDAKVLLIDHQKYENRVEYISYKEKDNHVYVLVKDESGSKMWANMLTLACQEADGKERPVNKADLAKENFTPLAK